MSLQDLQTDPASRKGKSRSPDRSDSRSNATAESTYTRDTAEGRSTPVQSPIKNKSSNSSEAVGTSEVARPSATSLKPRTSRWADEIDEDDQFIPIKSAFTSVSVSSSVAARKPAAAAPSPTRLARRATPAVLENPLIRTGESRGYKPRPALPVVREAAPVIVAPKIDLEEVQHMKEIMTKKAEERKKQKEAEEAQAEVERKARCQAKLKEIEERQKSRGEDKPVAEVKQVLGKQSDLKKPEMKHTAVGRTQSTEKKAVASQSVERVAPIKSVAAPVATVAIVAKLEDPEIAVKRKAFNEKRKEAGLKRGYSIPSPEVAVIPNILPSESSESAADSSRLSARAVEFIPHHQPHQPPHWQHPQFGYPQPPPYYPFPPPQYGYHPFFGHQQ